MYSENLFTVKISPNLAKAVQQWLPRISNQYTVQSGTATLTKEGDLHFNSKNIRSLLMHADDSASQIETFRLKKQALELLKMEHQKISAFGNRRLSLEDDIQELRDAEIGFYSRS
jgi:hypothetical protein